MTGAPPVRVLVVEDDPVAGAAHASYVDRVPGFSHVGTAGSVAAALRALRPGPDRPEVDLVLLDLHLPDGNGLNLLQRLRAEGHRCDVVVVTSARDREAVARAVSQGAVLYLIKPFTFADFRHRLEQYAAYRQQMAAAGTDVVQAEVDAMLGELRARPRGASVPKGMSPESLTEVVAALRSDGEALSATEVAVTMGASRVTARRYLEHLADTGQVRRAQRYGRTGRPEVTYTWQG